MEKGGTEAPYYKFELVGSLMEQECEGCCMMVKCGGGGGGGGGGGELGVETGRWHGVRREENM